MLIPITSFMNCSISLSPLTGGVYSHYSLYSPLITSWPLSSQRCVPICPLELLLQMLPKASTLPQSQSSSYLLSNIWCSWTYSLPWITFFNWLLRHCTFVVFHVLPWSFLPCVLCWHLFFIPTYSPWIIPELDPQTSSIWYLHCLHWWSHLRLWC